MYRGVNIHTFFRVRHQWYFLRQNLDLFSLLTVHDYAQFEDFRTEVASKLLERYRYDHLCFNDDIQVENRKSRPIRRERKNLCCPWRKKYTFFERCFTKSLQATGNTNIDWPGETRCTYREPQKKNRSKR